MMYLIAGMTFIFAVLLLLSRQLAGIIFALLGLAIVLITLEGKNRKVIFDERSVTLMRGAFGKVRETVVPKTMQAINIGRTGGLYIRLTDGAGLKIEVGTNAWEDSEGVLKELTRIARVHNIHLDEKTAGALDPSTPHKYL